MVIIKQGKKSLLKPPVFQVWAIWQPPLPCYNDGTSAPSWYSYNQFIVTWERLCQTGATQVIHVLLTKPSSCLSANQAGASGWQNTYFINFQVTYSPMATACLMHVVAKLRPGIFFYYYLIILWLCWCNWKPCSAHMCSFQPFVKILYVIQSLISGWTALYLLNSTSQITFL